MHRWCGSGSAKRSLPKGGGTATAPPGGSGALVASEAPWDPRRQAAVGSRRPRIGGNAFVLVRPARQRPVAGHPTPRRAVYASWRATSREHFPADTSRPRAAPVRPHQRVREHFPPTGTKGHRPPAQTRTLPAHGHKGAQGNGANADTSRPRAGSRQRIRSSARSVTSCPAIRSVTASPTTSWPGSG